MSSRPETPRLGQQQQQRKEQLSFHSRPVPIDPQYWSPFWRAYNRSLLPVCSLQAHIDSLTQRLYPEMAQQQLEDRADVSAAADDAAANPAQQQADPAHSAGVGLKDVGDAAAAAGPDPTDPTASEAPGSPAAAASTPSNFTLWSSRTGSKAGEEVSDSDGKVSTSKGGRVSTLPTAQKLQDLYAALLRALHGRQQQDVQQQQQQEQPTEPIAGKGRWLCCCFSAADSMPHHSFSKKSPSLGRSGGAGVDAAWQQWEAAGEAAANTAWRHNVGRAQEMTRLHQLLGLPDEAADLLDD